MDPLRLSISYADFSDFHDFIESSSVAAFDTVFSSLQMGSAIEMHRLLCCFHLLYSNGFEAWMPVMVLFSSHSEISY